MTTYLQLKNYQQVDDYENDRHFIRLKGIYEQERAYAYVFPDHYQIFYNYLQTPKGNLGAIPIYKNKNGYLNFSYRDAEDYVEDMQQPTATSLAPETPPENLIAFSIRITPELKNRIECLCEYVSGKGRANFLRKLLEHGVYAAEQELAA